MKRGAGRGHWRSRTAGGRRWGSMVLLGLLLALSVCGCAGGGKKKSTGTFAATDGEQGSAPAFTVKELQVPDIAQSASLGMGGLVLAGEELVTGADSGEEFSLVRIPVDGGSAIAISLSMEGGELPLAMAVDEQGGAFVLVGQDSGEQSGAQNAAVTEEENAPVLSRVRLLHFDAEGERDREIVVDESPAGNYSCQALHVGGGKVLLSDSRGVRLLDADSGEVTRQLSKKAVYDEVSLLKDGTPVVCSYGKDGRVTVRELGEKSLSTTAVQDITDTRLFPGKGRTFYLSGGKGLWQYTLGKKRGKRVVAYEESDLVLEQPAGICALEEGYALLAADGAGSVLALRLSPREGEQSRAILTLGGYGIDSRVQEQVARYNQSSEKYRVQVHDYVSDETDSEDGKEPAGLRKLKKDLVSDAAPDILLLPDGLPVRSLVKKGAFLDLTDRMKRDGLFDEKQYLTNVFTATQIDGKSFLVTPAFYVTCIAAKRAVVGEGGLSLQKARELARARGIGETLLFGDLSRDEFLVTALEQSGSRYVNREKKTCSFDGKAFRDLLTYAGAFPEELPVSEGDSSSAYREDRALLKVSLYYRIEEYQADLQGTFGEAVTLMGFPTDGKRTRPVITPRLQLAVCAATKNRDGAWAFVRSLLQADAQKSYPDGTDTGIPVRRESFEQMLENGRREKDPPAVTYVGLTEVELAVLTREETGAFRAMVESADHTAEVDRKILDIVREEAEAYFAGQKTAAEVSGIIQSRVRIYIQESG